MLTGQQYVIEDIKVLNELVALLNKQFDAAVSNNADPAIWLQIGNTAASIYTANERLQIRLHSFTIQNFNPIPGASVVVEG